MGDLLTPYETGLQRLLKRLGKGHRRYTEALVLQARLQENINKTRLYGDIPSHQTERMEVIDRLNNLCLDTMEVDFNELSITVVSVQIQVIVDGDLPNFTDERRDTLVRVLASVLQVDPDDVRILRVHGS